MNLTERQKKFLRRTAHSLKPVLSSGDKGVSAAFMQELNTSLEHHELLKVRFRAGDRDDRDAAIEQVSGQLGAMLISRIGNVATFYRPRKKNPRMVLPPAGAQQ